MNFREVRCGEQRLVRRASAIVVARGHEKIPSAVRFEVADENDREAACSETICDENGITNILQVVGFLDDAGFEVLRRAGFFATFDSGSSAYLRTGVGHHSF